MWKYPKHIPLVSQGWTNTCRSAKWDLLQTQARWYGHITESTTNECIPYNTDYFFKVTSAEHTQSRDVPTWGKLLIIMCYRQLMPGIIFTRLAWFFSVSKQKVEGEVWNKMWLPSCEKTQEVKCGWTHSGSAEIRGRHLLPAAWGLLYHTVRLQVSSLTILY